MYNNIEGCQHILELWLDLKFSSVLDIEGYH